MTALSEKGEFALNVNGEMRTVVAYPMERLLDVLRNELGLDWRERRLWRGGVRRMRNPDGWRTCG